MALLFFNNTPFNSATELSPLDLFTGTGSQTAFTVTNKSGTGIGSTIQFDSTQYFRHLGGFSVAGNIATLSSAPPSNSQGVIPGISSLVLNAFDTDTVPITTPRIDAKEFFIADVTEIGTMEYQPVTGQIGIQITFVDNITSVGPTLAWVQLACSDAAGNALAYAATGATLYTPNISYFSTLSASSAALASSITVVQASGYVLGDYVLINVGQATQEVVKITARSGNILTISGTNFNHFIGETVHTCGRKFWARLTVPVNATSGLAQTYFDLGLKRTCKRSQRL